MPRFDIYPNPNKAAGHVLYVDVQSHLVRLGTRWCIPLSRHVTGKPIIKNAQALIAFNQLRYVLDTPSLLAVPVALLRQQVGRLSPGEQLMAESCIEFMLRGY